MREHTYRGPRNTISAPRRATSECPCCGHSPFKAPGPCQKCGVAGYSSGEPPAYRKRTFGEHPTIDPEFDNMEEHEL